MNRRHGAGKFYNYETGDSYEGECCDDHAHGKGTMQYGNGDLYVGTWVKDERDGPGKLVIKESGSVYVNYGLCCCHVHYYWRIRKPWSSSSMLYNN